MTMRQNRKLLYATFCSSVSPNPSNSGHLAGAGAESISVGFSFIMCLLCRATASVDTGSKTLFPSVSRSDSLPRWRHLLKDVIHNVRCIVPREISSRHFTHPLHRASPPIVSFLRLEDPLQ